MWRQSVKSGPIARFMSMKARITDSIATSAQATTNRLPTLPGSAAWTGLTAPGQLRHRPKQIRRETASVVYSFKHDGHFKWRTISSHNINKNGPPKNNGGGG